MSFPVPRLRTALVGIIGAAAVAALAPATALADHFEPNSTKTCGTLNPNTNQVACTLTIAIDENENVGVQQSEVISVSLNPGTTGASYASATATGGTCPGTSNVAVAGPTQINVDPQAPGNINNCTIIVEEVLNATSAGQVCQTLDSVVNAPPHTVCAQIGAPPTSSEQCENGGWETYGFFKNRGDCVSFVATGGKNEPGQNVPNNP